MAFPPTQMIRAGPAFDKVWYFPGPAHRPQARPVPMGAAAEADSGARSWWATRDDYVLDLVAPFIPRKTDVRPGDRLPITAFASVGGVQEILHAMQKDPFRFYADAGNLVDSPAMDADAGGGVVDDFTGMATTAGVTAAASLDTADGAQKITMSAWDTVGDEASVAQRIRGIAANDVLSLAVDARWSAGGAPATPGTRGEVQLKFRSAADADLAVHVATFTNGAFARTLLDNRTAPANTASVVVQLGIDAAELQEAGESGSVWFRDAILAFGATAPAWKDNGRHRAYLLEFEDMLAQGGAYYDVRLRMRDVDGNPFRGF